MSEVTEVTVNNRAASLPSFAPHWGGLDRGLRFLVLAEQLATPVHAAMAVAASGASVALAVLVSAFCWVLAIPLSIVAATLAAGMLVKWYRRRRRKHRRNARDRVAARERKIARVARG